MDQQIVDSPSGADLSGAADSVEAKIIHILEIYPYISRAMIQISLGPACPPALWDPVLQEALKQGKIKVAQTTNLNPSRRRISRDVYHLPKYPYPPVTSSGLEDLAAR